MTSRKKTGLALAFFALCAAMTAFYLIAGYGAYLDADMASELALAQQLVREHTLISTSWHYSTEVRLLNTQMVFAPLMAVFGHDWRLVRTLGCMILLAVLAASSLYAARRIGAKAEYALVFAGLNISVCSPLYAQNVIIGAYYVPHAVLTMVTLGLYAGVLREKRRRGMRTGALLMLSLVMGMSSVRYLLAALAPVFCAAVWQLVFAPRGEETARTAEQLGHAGLAAGAALLGALGFAVNQKVLPMWLHCRFDYYGGTGYADWMEHDLPRQMQTALYGLLSAMGFEGGVPLFGVQGVINALVLLTLAAGAMMIFRALRGLRRDEDGEAARAGVLMLVFASGLSLAMFVLLRSVYFDRYWLPVMMLGAPVMALCLSREGNLALRRLVLMLTAGTVLLTSASCMYYSMRHPQVETDMRMEAVNAIRERGLDKGYATFWNANIVTELSNGEIEVVALEQGRDEAGQATLHLMSWLEAEENLTMDRPEEPVFLLLGTWEDAEMGAFLQRAQAVRVELDGWINLYEIPSQRALFEAMDEAETS